MNHLELEALKAAFGLSHVTDADELRAAIEQRLANMNAPDRAAIQIDIGRRVAELEARSPGARFSPATWSLAVVAVVAVGVSGAAGAAVIKTDFSPVLKIGLALIATVAFVMAWRSIARVLYRVVNKRDM